MPLKSGAYVAIEGPIGAGKTSLAKMLAAEMDMRLILEGADHNPYLEDFYSDPRRFALQTQLNFLMSRHRQQAEITQLSLFHRAVVTDYIFEKDSIFANLTLEERDLDLYNKVAALFSAEIPTPDLVVYLQSLPDRLLTNIQMRAIGYERTISAEYLSKLCEAYNKFFFSWEKSSLLVVNANKIDFVKNENEKKGLVDLITSMPKGINFYNPES